MSKRSSIRRAVVAIAALALASMVIVGGIDTSLPAQAAQGGSAKLGFEGPIPPLSCPQGSGLTTEQVYPAAGQPYRGVIVCYGPNWGGDDFYIQGVDLQNGGGMRLVSHPTDGQTLGNAETQFDKLYSEDWRTSMGSYSPEWQGELFSVTNAGFFSATATATTSLSFPERKANVVTSMGAAYLGGNNAATLNDWNSGKRVLTISNPPGLPQSVLVSTFGAADGHYTNTEVNTLSAAGPLGGYAYDATVGFTPYNGPGGESRRTWLGVPSTGFAWIVTTDDLFELQQMRSLFQAMGVSIYNVIQLDGGGSTQFSTKVPGLGLESNDLCGIVPCQRRVPQVLAIYEGNPHDVDRAIVLGDIDADGRDDVIARKGDGTLWAHINPGSNPVTFDVASGTQIGNGWNEVVRFAAGDLNADNYDDLVTQRRDGTLQIFLNSHNASAPFPSSTQVGSGWSQYRTWTLGVVNPGDSNADIIAIKPDGTAWRWVNSGNTSAPFPAGTQIASGWGGYTSIKLGDLTQDGLDDLVSWSALGYPEGGGVRVRSNFSVSATDPQPFTASEVMIKSWPSQYNRFAVGDVTGDGFDDLIATKGSTTGMEMYVNNHPMPPNFPLSTTNPFNTAPVLISAGWGYKYY